MDITGNGWKLLKIYLHQLNRLKLVKKIIKISGYFYKIIKYGVTLFEIDMETGGSARKSAQARKQCLQESYGKVGKLWRGQKEKQEVRSSKQGKFIRKQEVGSRKKEVGSRKQVIGSRKQEVGSRKQEVGRRKQEVGARNQELGMVKFC